MVGAREGVAQFVSDEGEGAPNVGQGVEEDAIRVGGDALRRRRAGGEWENHAGG